MDWASISPKAPTARVRAPGVGGRVARFFDALKRCTMFRRADDLAPPGYFQALYAMPSPTWPISHAPAMAGAPVRGENYFKADIAAGRIG